MIDHKTAHPKAAGKDPFHGQYETQVVGYAYIADGMGFGESHTRRTAALVSAGRGC